jgi:hypothetical protein
MFIEANSDVCVLDPPQVDVLFNPLTPDLNPLVQRQPAEVFKFGIQFLTLTLRKKNHISYTFPSNFRK